MNAPAPRGYRNGRAARLRARLLSHPRPQSAADLAASACPEATVTEVLRSLAVMARAGVVERVGAGWGVTWQLTEAGRKAAQTEASPPRPAPPKATTPRTRTFLVKPTPPGRNEPRTARLPNDRDHARVVIEADIAAFERAGGRIERLGATPVLTRIGIDYDASNDE